VIRKKIEEWILVKKEYQTGFTGLFRNMDLRPDGISPQAKQIFTPLNFEEQRSVFNQGP
jgi:hypothetical protein